MRKILCSKNTNYFIFFVKDLRTLAKERQNILVIPTQFGKFILWGKMIEVPEKRFSGRRERFVVSHNKTPVIKRNANFQNVSGLGKTGKE